MRWTPRLIAPLIAASLSFAALPAGAATPMQVANPGVAPASGVAAADFAWVNSLRAAAGVAPLQEQTWAEGVAQAHSIDMANTGSLFHNMTGYMAVGHTAMNASYLGENVAEGTTIDYAQGALQASPPHMANILNPRFNYVGVAAATDASGQVWITEDFAEIGAAAPAPPAPAPKPVVTAPKPVVTAPKPVVTAPKPAVVVTASPAPIAPVPAAAATPSPAPSPAPSAAPSPVHTTPAPAQPVALSLAAHHSPANPGAEVLYAALGLLAALFTLGLGYRLTRLLPGR